MGKSYKKLGLVVLLAQVLCVPSQAWGSCPLAYLDPGTGSYIFQLLIAGLVGAGFAVKLFWGYIKAFVVSTFSRKKHKDDDQQS
ncbi:MAG TPA: hypothetical protein ENN97_05775 [Phycisphaerales bacterium]|mgnify:CR=1 FL=1|nr:hypothetical protein [Phycisphaerales bacterium]